VKDERHRIAARPFFNTFPAGMPVSLPLLSAAERRSIRRASFRSARIACLFDAHDEPFGNARPRARRHFKSLIFELFQSGSHRFTEHQKFRFWKTMELPHKLMFISGN
jgi:hypothetical protein